MLLEAKNISHKFEKTLYEKINLTLKKRESIAIMGVSGSGKSTLLNNLSTMLQPISGQVSILGLSDIYKLSQSDLTHLRRKEIGIIFQFHYLFRGFSAQENLELSCILSNKELDVNLLKKFNIEDVLHQPIGELSGGQQQRLSIVRVLAKKPKIIFADEPTGNLDSANSSDVINTLLAYIHEANACLVLATHDINIAKMCDRIYILENAKLERKQ